MTELHRMPAIWLGGQIRDGKISSLEVTGWFLGQRRFLGGRRCLAGDGTMVDKNPGAGCQPDADAADQADSPSEAQDQYDKDMGNETDDSGSRMRTSRRTPIQFPRTSDPT
jgi:hypothetical protein